MYRSSMMIMHKPTAAKAQVRHLKSSDPKAGGSDHLNRVRTWPDSRFKSGIRYLTEHMIRSGRKSTAAVTAMVALVCFTQLAYGLPSPSALRVENPYFTLEPQNQTVTEWQSATFTVTAKGDEPLSYLWTYNGAAVRANSNVYTHANCQLSDNGGRVQVTVSNSFGLMPSRTAILSVNSAGTIYFAGPNGSSANTGFSTDSPWPLQYALKNVAPFSTVILLDGVYKAAGVSADGGFSLQTTDNVTIKAQNQWKAIITGSTNFGILASSYAGSSGAYTTDHITFDGLCVSNNAGDGMAVSHDSIVRNCWVIGNGRQGINISSAACSNNVIEHNLIENNGTIAAGTTVVQYHGLYLSGANNIVRGNVVRYNSGFGIHVFTEYAGVQQDNNSIYNNLTYGHTNAYGVAIWGAVNGGSLPGTNYCFNNTILDGLQLYYGTAWVTNNIILPSQHNPTTPMYVSSSAPSTVSADYNLGTNTISPVGAHNVITNVARTTMFVNLANGLYWLSATSPARNTAKPDVFGPTDFFGNGQSSVHDIGAFQYDPTLVGDTRVLDPSPADPDYWALP